MKYLKYNGATEVISAIFILLFTYTAMSKLFEHRVFLFTLKSSPFISKWAYLLSWLLPVVELIAALILLIPAIRLIGLYLSFALMIIFTCYIGFMLFTFSKLPCSCGGILKQLSWKNHWILNIALMVLAGIATVVEFKRIKSFKPYTIT